MGSARNARTGKMHVILRHCSASTVSAHKKRPAGFSRESLFKALLPLDADVHIVLDSDKPHFCEDATVKLHKQKLGSESASFKACLELAKTFPLEDTVVFLEDDYKVSKHWLPLITEGLEVAKYVTLYDHPDKYAQDIISKIYCKPQRHWRTTPSTTNSFATRVSTLVEDMDIHIQYSSGPVTNDHGKFLHLWSLGRSLVSCMPAAWSHEEDGMQCVIKEVASTPPESEVQTHVVATVPE